MLQRSANATLRRISHVAAQRALLPRSTLTLDFLVAVTNTPIRFLSAGPAASPQSSEAQDHNSSYSNEAPSATPIAKPRAAHGATTAKRTRRFWSAAIAGGSMAFVAYLAYKYKSVKEAVDALRGLVEGVVDTQGALSDPTVDELQRALGPAPPDFYITVLLALDDVIVRREWDRRYGWRHEIRPGTKELLKALLEAGVMVTFWSEATSAVASETAMKLSMDFGMALPVSPLHLGSEHCFTRRTDNRKEKHIDHFNRDPKTVLLVDADPLSESVTPRNTIIVKRMSDVEKEATAAASEGRPAQADTTLQALSQLVARIRSDAQATGDVNVPQSLAALKAEAAAAGFSRDAAGIAAYMQHEARTAAELDQQRREAGLGGMLRRTLESSNVLRNKPALADAAAARRYRDPTPEIGRESFLAQRLRAANARLDNQH